MYQKAAALLALCTAACATPTVDQAAPGAPNRNPAFIESETVKRILAHLELRSVSAKPRDISAVDLMYDAPGPSYDIDGGSLYLHRYRFEGEATLVKSRIIKGAGNVDWVKPPTFFQCGEVIAMYAGESHRVLGALGEASCIAFYSALPQTPRG